MKRINILFLSSTLCVGGAEQTLFNLITNLDRRKFNPVVCCLYHPSSTGIDLIEKKIKVYHNLMRNKWDIIGVWRLIHILKKEDIYIVYIINQPLTQFWGTISAKLAGIPICVTAIHYTGTVFHVKRRKIINKIVFPFVNKVIAVAKSQKNYFIQRRDIDAQKIEVINNGVDVSRFTIFTDNIQEKKRLKIPYSVPIVGIVARLEPRKGHDVFLKAAKIVLDDIPEVHFLVVGDGEERRQLEYITQDLGINSNVHFLGNRSDIPEIISLFDIGVLSSNTEALPISILEYMASMKPVVATNVGGISELVVDRKSGFLCPPQDHIVLANAILKLLKDKQLAIKMGDAGRKRVEEKFTVQKMVNETERLFEELIEQKFGQKE